MSDNEWVPENLNIKVVNKESLISIRHARPPLLAQDDLISVGKTNDEKLQVLVGPRAFSVIDSHAKSDTRRELGGFLVGRPYSWDGKMYVEITQALPGELTSSSAAHLTLSPDTWARAQAAVRQDHPGMHIVGWYHTHPRMCVFMSSRDLSIHEGFFREAWHVSLVMEPSRGEAGFYIWDELQVRLAEGYSVLYPENLPSEERWQYPRSLDLDSRPRTIDEFYETSYWHTRWKPSDENVVKVSSKAMESIEGHTSSGSSLAFGVCSGRVWSNVERGRGPRFYIEVLDASPVLEVGSVERMSRSYLVDVWRERVANIKSISHLHVLGGYVITGSVSLGRSLYKFIYRTIFPNLWQVIISGRYAIGEKYCTWRGIKGRLVKRPLIEAVALPDLSGDELREKLKDLRFVWQEGPPRLDDT